MIDAMLDELSADSGERQRLGLMFDRAPGFMALIEGADQRFALANRGFADLVGRGDLVGKTLPEALPELADQGLDDILSGVARSGEPFVGHAMPLTVVRKDGSPEEVLVDLVFQPVPESAGRQASIFIQGNNTVTFNVPGVSCAHCRSALGSNCTRLCSRVSATLPAGRLACLATSSTRERSP